MDCAAHCASVALGVGGGLGGRVVGSGGLGGGRGGRGATLQPAAAWRLAQVAENQYGSGALIGPDSGRAAECGNIGERHTRPRWMTERREVVGEGQRSGGLGVRGRKHALRMMDEKTRTQRSDTRAQFMSCVPPSRQSREGGTSFRGGTM